MSSVWKRGNIWYVTYENRFGKRVTISSKMRHERDAQTLANQLVTREMLARHGVVDAGNDKFRLTDATPLIELLALWQKDVEARGNTDKHARERHNQAVALFQLGGMEFFPQISRSAVQIALGELRKKGKSLQTLNHHLRAVKSFCRWLWHDGRTAADPIAGLRGYNAQTDRRRRRRSMTVEEVRALYKAADEGKVIFHMTGEERGMLYRVMLGTGFRVNEIRSLRGKSCLLEETPPVLVVAAGFSKRRREDRQPIRVNLATLVKAYVKKRGIGPDDPLFRLPDKPNRVFTADLQAAGVKVKDEHGHILDLHALRHTYITEMARQGFPPKMAQQLARHSSITLTLDFYTHLEDDDAAKTLGASGWFGEKGDKKAEGA